MNDFYPTYKSKLKPWIKFWILKGNKIAPKVLSEVIEGTTPITIEGVYKGTSLQDLVFKGQTVQEGTPSPEAPIPVQVVKEDNYININEESYRVDLGGKNIITSANVINSNIELCKIGNYQDKLYYNSGKWYIEKKIGKVVLNGDSNIEKYDNNGRYYIRGILATKGSINSPNVMSNYYKAAFALSNGNIFSSSVNGTINMTNTSYLNDLAGFKTWLSTHNTTVYYVLAESTTTEITETTLLSQLEAIKNATLISGTNEITQTPADLPFILNFKYYMKG